MTDKLIEEKFDKRFTDNPVFWAELVAEWHQGDIDVKPFKKFMFEALADQRTQLLKELQEKFEPAFEDFNGAGQTLIEYGYTKSGTEMIENVGYMKSLLIEGKE